MSRTTLTMLCLALLTMGSAAAQSVHRVDVDATGAADGTSWADAFPDLQPALDIAVSGDSIWVAEGTYLPSKLVTPGAPRSATYVLVDGVTLVGGFAGGETSVGQSDPDAHLTILSGNIGGPGAGDNAFHVCTGAGLGPGSRLEGFHIRDGVSSTKGGGLELLDSHFELRRCTFEGNSAMTGGGAIHALSSSPTVLLIEGCRFLFNGETPGGTVSYGGAVRAQGQALTVRDTLFQDNVAVAGCGLYATDCPDLLIEDCAFLENIMANAALQWGGALTLYEGNPGAVIRRTRFEDNLGLGTCPPPCFAGFGAAVGIYNNMGSVTFQDCDFLRNKAQRGGAVSHWQPPSFGEDSLVFENCRFIGNGALHRGGAIEQLGSKSGQCVYPRDLLIIGCLFRDNIAQVGGALWLENSCARTVSTRFVGNWGDGSAIYLLATGTSERFPRFINSVFANNTGGSAVVMKGLTSPLFVNCTLANNATHGLGGAVHGVGTNPQDEPKPRFNNSILWGNTDQNGSLESSQVHMDFGQASAFYTIVQGLTGTLGGGSGNLGSDPLFVDAPNGNFRLRPGSPAIDSGSNDAVEAQADVNDLDCDGDLAEALPLDLDRVLRRADDIAVADSGLGTTPLADRGAYERGAWQQLGAGLAGALGVPCLVAGGTLEGDLLVDVTLTNVPPNSLSALFAGPTRLDFAGFYGGTLVPSPDLLIVVPTGPGGGWTLEGPFPTGLPSGFDHYIQAWVEDPGAPYGFAGSNALRGTTP